MNEHPWIGKDVAVLRSSGSSYIGELAHVLPNQVVILNKPQQHHVHTDYGTFSNDWCVGPNGMEDDFSFTCQQKLWIEDCSGPISLHDVLEMVLVTDEYRAICEDHLRKQKYQ